MNLSYFKKVCCGCCNVDVGLLVQRVSFSLILILAHGYGKLANFSMIAAHFPDPIGLGGSFSLALAIFAEVICPVLIILGLFTRLACLPVIGVMAVATCVIHAQDPWAQKELAVMYFIAFVCIGLLGAGKYDVKYLLKKLK